MTITEHDQKCPKVLYVDMTTVEQARNQGWGNVRLFCLDGHSAWEAVELPKVHVERPAVTLPDYCSDCGEQFDAGENKKREYCKPCRTARRLANLQRPKYVRVSHCGWCLAPIASGERYCSPEHQQARNKANREAAKQRDLANNALSVAL